MNYSKDEIGEMIKNFKHAPSKNIFNIVNVWYGQYHGDDEFKICVLIFLLAGNITHHYYPITSDEQMSIITKITSLLNGSLQRYDFYSCAVKSKYF